MSKDTWIASKSMPDTEHETIFSQPLAPVVITTYKDKKTSVEVTQAYWCSECEKEHADTYEVKT